MSVYRVVKIIDEYRLVVNSGTEDGIKVNDELEIFVPGKPIIDPETKEDLGTLDYIKARLVVADVFPKMCVCVNAKEESTIPFSVYSSLFKTQRLPLNVDVEEISGGYEKVDSKIKIGDLVRKPE